MRKTMLLLATGLVGVLATLVSQAATAFPRTLNYQGRVTNEMGDPIDGEADVIFRLYPDPTTETWLWEETQTGVQVVNGVFTVRLGSEAPLTNELFSLGTVYLGIEFVGVGSGELSPRTPLDAVGYAFRVESLTGSSGGTVDGDVEVTGQIETETIYSEDGITIKTDSGDAVVIAGATEVRISPGGTVTISGADLALTATGDITMDATNIELNATASVSIDGSAGVDVSAGGTCSVQGSLLTLN